MGPARLMIFIVGLASCILYVVVYRYVHMYNVSQYKVLIILCSHNIIRNLKFFFRMW